MSITEMNKIPVTLNTMSCEKSMATLEYSSFKPIPQLPQEYNAVRQESHTIIKCILQDAMEHCKKNRSSFELNSLISTIKARIGRWSLEKDNPVTKVVQSILRSNSNVLEAAYNNARERDKDIDSYIYLFGMNEAVKQFKESGAEHEKAIGNILYTISGIKIDIPHSRQYKNAESCTLF